MRDTIKFRRGLKTGLSSLLLGEPALVTDEKRLYVGGDSENIAIPNKADIDSINSSLADIPNKSYNSSLVKQHISKAFQGQGNGMYLTVIGNSISQGVGASSIDKSYVSLLFDAIKKVTNNGKGAGYELTGNFQAPPEGFVYGGTTSYGALGPCKKSLIMQPGATITFTRNPYEIELYYHQTPTSGKIEFRKDGVLYRTLDCSGVDTLDVNSFSSMVTLDGLSHVYTLTCINAQVELTGVECWANTVTANTIYYNRFAVSGTTSNYWNNTALLASIKEIGALGGRKSVFILALGTNDCYQVGGAVSSATYKANMTAIINSLISAGHYVVLTVPPKANETTFPPQVEPYANYVQVIKDLAEEFNLPYTDLSTIDFNGNGWLADGVHPNDDGHYAIAKYHMDTLGIPQNISNNSLPDASRPTFQNSWQDFLESSGAIAEYYKDDVGRVYLQGLISSGIMTANTVIFVLPEGYRPKVDRYVPVVTNSGTGSLKIAVDGKVMINNISTNTYVSLDGVVFRAV